MDERKIPANIDEYIAGFPAETQVILEKIRETIRSAAPEAEETISYAMPTFKLESNLVYFAAFKKYIGFYPTPSGVKEFQKELAVYENAKGSIRFPLDQPIPYNLISKIVAYRVQENLKKARAKRKTGRG